MERQAPTLHRIDPDVVKRDAPAAGFTFAGESGVLHDPADDHSASVMENRGKSDRFVYKVVKPATQLGSRGSGENLQKRT
jgi:predicted methyltransferase